MTTGPENGATGGVRHTHKSDAAFRTISEVSTELSVPQHVLRFWETRFPAIQPMKRGGGRRYYRPEDVVLLKAIRDHLYNDGFTIKGVRKLLDELGVEAFVSSGSRAVGTLLSLGDESEPVLPFDLPQALSPQRVSSARSSLSARQRSEVEAAVRHLEGLKNTLDQALACDVGEL